MVNKNVKIVEYLTGTFCIAASRYDPSRQLITYRTNSQSFSGGAEYPAYWVSILVGRIVLSGVRFLGGALSAGVGRFGSLHPPDSSRQVGWPSAGFSSRLAD